MALGEINLAAPRARRHGGKESKGGKPAGELLRKPSNDGLDEGDGSGIRKEKVSLG